MEKALCCTAAAALVAGAAWIRQRETEVAALQRDLAAARSAVEEEKERRVHEESKREAERVGRIRAEAALRKAALETNGDGDAAGGEAGGGMEMAPIGVLRSSYRKRFGTPRQGSVVSAGRAVLKMHQGANPVMSTTNLADYSHVWLIYIFHENTNFGRKAAGKAGVKSLVRPPRLGGEKVGLFSTRTPHRPNPIGLSLVRLDKVDAQGTLYLSGIDLIDKTPILDVKPYLPMNDSVHLPAVPRIPDWLESPTIRPNEGVELSGAAQAELRDHVLRGRLEFYDEYEDVWAAIEEALLCDIRSLQMRARDDERAAPSEGPPEGGVADDARFHFDNIDVRFTVASDGRVLVSSCALCRVPKT